MPLSLSKRRCPLCLQRPFTRLQFASYRLDPCRVPVFHRHHIHLPDLLDLALGTGMPLEGGLAIDPALVDLLYLRRGRSRSGNVGQRQQQPDTDAHRQAEASQQHRPSPRTAASVARGVDGNRDGLVNPSATRLLPTVTCGDCTPAAVLTDPPATQQARQCRACQGFHPFPVTGSGSRTPATTGGRRGRSCPPGSTASHRRSCRPAGDCHAGC